ncbi:MULTISPECIES: FAD:protein FMN transferase [unclassified Rathayibacter]|uniref:FAD:protein FMN transferase n=1 Tax=unclassified Rathayibacter TaxID=2609250 RepID=UPI0010DAC109|nr:MULTISPECIES: FAD:protein FMN transferase [unclassified Rathayibacter]TCL83609.1 thiamine biosynthesis lipoprotein [Rathayibacter sp. PhB192]TCM29202.1 thiamine biosynthesis lipoprotein [Rathayibacter sp. PhB179]
MISTFPTMGTVASLRAEAEAPLAAIRAVFRSADERFSLYRPESEASRIADGRLRLADASAEMRDAYAEALEWRTATDGAFTPHRPDGVLDLAGTVKARAIAAAGRLLERGGDAPWLLTVGGDVLGSRAVDANTHADPVRIGIVDPDDRRSLLCAVPIAGDRRAVATSGTAERGEHVWRRPHDADGVRFRQVTVLAGDILTADVLATAVLAGGEPTLDRVLSRWDVDVLACGTGGDLLVSDRLRAAISARPTMQASVIDGS